MHKTRAYRTLLLLVLWWGVATLRAQTPFSCNGQFFLTLVTQNSGALYQVTIDPFTGRVQFLPVGSPLGININAIGYRRTDNLIYGVDPNNFQLYRIDANAKVQTLAVLPLNPGFTYVTGDITPDGRSLVLIGGSRSGNPTTDREIAKVDLTDPNYGVVSFPMPVTSSRMFDIAFDPTTGKLYGFDANNNRLVVINPGTGDIDNSLPATNVMESNGSLFFDAFGHLYAYGSQGGSGQNILFRADTKTGRFTVLTEGPLSTGSDGCSCPYTVELVKTVTPDTTFPCGEVEYAFIIANASGLPLSGIDFDDPLPESFRISAIVRNPFGGTVVSGTGTNRLQIRNMFLPVGIDTMIIRVTTGNLPSGNYRNQALLSGLPPSLGTAKRSDDPKTAVRSDSTTLVIKGIDFDTLTKYFTICAGNAITLDAAAFGNNFEWFNGARTPAIQVAKAGVYPLTVAQGCDKAVVQFAVNESDIRAGFQPSQLVVDLGDSIRLNPIISNTGAVATYVWTKPADNSLSCLQCRQPFARPFFDIRYTLEVTNEYGCHDTATVFVTVDKERLVYAPNVFSPNYDGKNDVFYLQGKGYGEIRLFALFDRWGEKVFEHRGGQLNDPATGWDGRFRGREMDDNVFVWYAEIEFLDGVTKVLSGDVTLIR